MLTAVLLLLACVIVGLLLNKAAGRVSLAVLSLLSGSALLQAAPPAYAGSAFDQIQEVADDGMLFFGVIIAGAVIVTGFFLGRKWLKRVG